MKQRRPNRFWYAIARLLSRIVSKYLFRPKILRNEIKGKKGPFVVIANHQAALDFINLIGATRAPMHFVVSDCFYNTLSVRPIMKRIGVIPKQQFQTSLTDMKLMRSVLDQGRPLVIYPAGLMCEDGLSTPIPRATYQFLKWTRADIYVARTFGTYFVKPKWSKKSRPGKTYLDIYRLFTKDELAGATLDDIRQKTDEALLFDAYRDQDARPVLYRAGDNVQGLEHVVYRCPHCGAEFTIRSKNKSTLYCTECAFEVYCDKYGFLHSESGDVKCHRYVSDWSREIYEDLYKKVANGTENSITFHASICVLNHKRRKFAQAGCGTLTLSRDGFLLTECDQDTPIPVQIPISSFASLPFQPGQCFDIQHGKDIYRCFPDDPSIVMKVVNLVKVFYAMHTEEVPTQRR